MNAYAIVKAVLQEIARGLLAAGLHYDLNSTAPLAATATLPSGFRATFAGPPGRQLEARIFVGAEEATVSVHLRDTPTDRTVHVSAFLKHLNRPMPFSAFKFDAHLPREDAAAAGARIVDVLTGEPRLKAVLGGGDWIDVPFDWGDWK
jgi:hypothetical protein